MLETYRKEWQARIAVISFLILTFFWLILPSTGEPDTFYYKIFSALYGLMAIWGGVWGIAIAKNWGGFKSVLGRSILMFSLGLIAQEFGQIVYSYYNYVLQIVPYPSLGDLGFFAAIPLYIYGSYLLAKASGVKVSLRSFSSIFLAVLIPVLMLSIGYLIFLKDYAFDWSQPLTVFLDFAYPLGEAIYLSIALLTFLLTRKLLGGAMRNKILFILFALLAQFIADWTFLYQASKGVVYPGGVNDYIYLCAYILMTYGLFQLNTTVMKLRNSNN